MADVGRELTAYLLADEVIRAWVAGKRIHQNKVPQNFDKDYIWFMRRASDTLCLDGDDEDFQLYYDLEIVSKDINQALEMAENVKTRLRDMSEWPNFGTTGAAYISVDDHDDQYFARNDFGDEGIHVPSLDLAIVPCTGE